jgi:histidinol-phosphate aminotransferase
MPVASLTQWWGGCAAPTTRGASASTSSSGRTPRLQVRATAMQEKASASANDSSTRFLRPHLLKLAAYTPIEPFEVLSARFGRTPQEIIKLDANENPYGPPPEVREALASMPFPHIYPDPETRRLRHALAEMNGIEAEHLMVSRREGEG